MLAQGNRNAVHLRIMEEHGDKGHGKVMEWDTKIMDHLCCFLAVLAGESHSVPQFCHPCSMSVGVDGLKNTPTSLSPVLIEFVSNIMLPRPKSSNRPGSQSEVLACRIKSILLVFQSH